jgi:hypothetical protein
MKWIGPNQPLVEWDTGTTHSNPGPLRVVVRGFARYRDRVESLDVLEPIRLRVLTDFIAESFDPDCLPITGIHVVGHADTDAQRGRSFEQQISEARAKNVQAYLKKEVERRTWTFSILQNPPPPPPGVPTAATIDWKTPRGVGATQPDPENVRRGRAARNMTEEDRKRNRRVEIILEPGDSPMPGVTAELVRKILDDIFHGRFRMPLPPPPLIPPLPKWMWDPRIMPKPIDTVGWFRFCDQVKDWLESHHIDPGPFLDWLKGVVFPDNKWPVDDDYAKAQKAR